MQKGIWECLRNEARWHVGHAWPFVPSSGAEQGKVVFLLPPAGAERAEESQNHHSGPEQGPRFTLLAGVGPYSVLLLL